MEGRLRLHLLRSADSNVGGEPGAFEHALLELLKHSDTVLSFASLLRAITCLEACIRADYLA